MKVLTNLKSWYRGLPDKKRYFELISAALTIPVMITVLWNNVGNIKQKNASPEPMATPEPKESVQIVIVSSPGPETPRPSPSPTTACKETIGPVEIVSPRENEVITRDPVVVEIGYPDDSFCGIVWSYRVNSGPWSNFTDREISLFGLTNGSKTLEIKIKSQVIDQEMTLRRNFTVESDSTAPSASPSGGLTQ